MSMRERFSKIKNRINQITPIFNNVPETIFDAVTQNISTTTEINLDSRNNEAFSFGYQETIDLSPSNLKNKTLVKRPYASSCFTGSNYENTKSAFEFVLFHYTIFNSHKTIFFNLSNINYGQETAVVFSWSEFVEVIGFLYKEIKLRKLNENNQDLANILVIIPIFNKLITAGWLEYVPSEFQKVNELLKFIIKTGNEFGITVIASYKTDEPTYDPYDIFPCFKNVATSTNTFEEFNLVHCQLTNYQKSEKTGQFVEIPILKEFESIELIKRHAQPFNKNNKILNFAELSSLSNEQKSIIKNSKILESLTKPQSILIETRIKKIYE
jgi:hypothetical protein